MSIIPMYDFSKEYELNRDRYIAAFDRVCKTGHFAGGEFAERFERRFSEFVGSPYTAAVSNGTAALVLALKAAGVGVGDEVIVPSATFTATPGAVMMCGARPVFADCERNTWQISPESVRQRLTSKTAAVIGVHLYGGMFNVNAVAELAADAGIPMIEDAAQAFGASFNGRSAGTFGKAGCFSFYPTKNLGAFGDAGCVISADRAFIESVNDLKEHDMRREEYARLGYNMRMDGIQGEILTEKLSDAVGFIARKRSIAEKYRNALKDSSVLSCQSVYPGVEHSYHLFVVLADNRERFVKYMSEKGIATGVQYRLPCHRQKVFEGICGRECLPVTEELFSRCVSVPSYPYLSDGEVDRVAEALRNYG